MSGLSPKPGVNDAAMFSQFCESHLGVKPYVDERGVRRVGSASPLKLVVTLLSEHTASDVPSGVMDRRSSKLPPYFTNTALHASCLKLILKMPY